MTKEQSEKALKLLGLTPEDFAHVRRARNMSEGTRLLQELKDKAKKGYHKAALELHPDRNPGDVEKADLFCLACEAHEEIQQLTVRPPPRLNYGDDYVEALRYSIKVTLKPRRSDGRK